MGLFGKNCLVPILATRDHITFAVADRSVLLYDDIFTVMNNTEIALAKNIIFIINNTYDVILQDQILLHSLHYLR